ncbi:MAG: hypothetical protein N4A47_03210 [Clostridia bacterium]|jgi:hypothetical protein|nr:hypothetical protein [Clostridia bacterium]
MSSKNDFTVVTPSTHDWGNILNEFQSNGTDKYKKCSKSGVSLCMCNEKGERLETARQFFEIFTVEEVSKAMELEPENLNAVLDEFSKDIKEIHEREHHDHDKSTFVIA